MTDLSPCDCLPYTFCTSNRTCIFLWVEVNRVFAWYHTVQLHHQDLRQTVHAGCWLQLRSGCVNAFSSLKVAHEIGLMEGLP